MPQQFGPMISVDFYMVHFLCWVLVMHYLKVFTSEQIFYTGILKLKNGSLLYFTLLIEPSKIDVTIERVFLILILFAPDDGDPPIQPVLTKKTSTLYFSIFSYVFWVF